MITFHGALSEEFIDEENVLIEDLELDEESDDQQQRKSDIEIEGIGSQTNIRILVSERGIRCE